MSGIFDLFEITEQTLCKHCVFMENIDGGLWCRRNPLPAEVGPEDWCGEFQDADAQADLSATIAEVMQRRAENVRDIIEDMQGRQKVAPNIDDVLPLPSAKMRAIVEQEQVQEAKKFVSDIREFLSRNHPVSG